MRLKPKYLVLPTLATTAVFNAKKNQVKSKIAHVTNIATGAALTATEKKKT